MGDKAIRQRLAGILAADAAGYSRLMAADEKATVAALDSIARATGSNSKQALESLSQDSSNN